MLLTLVLYLLLGMVAGTLAGMFGVGGGLIIVPVLIYAFAHQGFDPAWLSHMAVATSLAVISVTSVSSVMAHHANRMVLWPVVRLLVPGLALGTAIGVGVVLQIPGKQLQWLIGAYLMLMSLQMGFGLMPSREAATLPGHWGMAAAGFFIGGVSAIFGIGGGSLSVPYLSYFGTKMKHAVATSAACGFPIAVAGMITNGLAGWGQPGLPAYSLGYVYVPAMLGIALASTPFARVGANIAKSLPEKWLKRLFAIFLAMIGALLIAATP